MKAILQTNVTVDRPTSTGRIFTRAAVERALVDPALRNRLRRGMIGGLLNRDGDRIAAIDEPTHLVTDIKLDQDGNIVVELDILDTPAGKRVQEAALNGKKLIAKPIIVVPDDQPTAESTTIDCPISFHKVQIEFAP
jgi:hypothetical protein